MGHSKLEGGTRATDCEPDATGRPGFRASVHRAESPFRGEIFAVVNHGASVGIGDAV